MAALQVLDGREMYDLFVSNRQVFETYDPSGDHRKFSQTPPWMVVKVAGENLQPPIMGAKVAVGSCHAGKTTRTVVEGYAENVTGAVTVETLLSDLRSSFQPSRSQPPPSLPPPSASALPAHQPPPSLPPSASALPARQPLSSTVPRPQVPSVHMRALLRPAGLGPAVAAQLEDNIVGLLGSTETSGGLAEEPSLGADLVRGLPLGAQRIVEPSRGPHLAE